MGMIMSCISNIMYLSEKLTLALTCVGLIICIVLTFIVTLGMGIGLGYNYCFVDLKTRLRHVPGHYIQPNHPRWPYLTDKKPKPDYQDLVEVSSDDALREMPKIPDELRITFIPAIVGEPVAKREEKPLRTNFYLKTNVGDKNHLQEVVASYLNVTEKPELEKPDLEYVKEHNVTTTAVVEVSKASSVSANDTNVVSNDSIAAETANRTVESHEDINKPPVVDINVSSADESGGKRVKKVVIPISGLDLISLLSKVKAENKNYSLQIVTT